jgi:hypothetical protein
VPYSRPAKAPKKELSIDSDFGQQLRKLRPEAPIVSHSNHDVYSRGNRAHQSSRRFGRTDAHTAYRSSGWLGVQRPRSRSSTLTASFVQSNHRHDFRLPTSQSGGRGFFPPNIGARAEATSDAGLVYSGRPLECQPLSGSGSSFPTSCLRIDQVINYSISSSQHSRSSGRQ